MIATRLEWPKRPKVTHDRCFDAPRQTWRCKNEAGYTISICQLDYCLVFPRWADKLPERFRTLKAAMQAAEEHRNADG